MAEQCRKAYVSVNLDVDEEGVLDLPASRWAKVSDGTLGLDAEVAYVAAGETTGGIHGEDRMSGNGMLDDIVFGRIAGKNAAAFAAGS